MASFLHDSQGAKTLRQSRQEEEEQQERRGVHVGSSQELGVLVRDVGRRHLGLFDSTESPSACSKSRERKVA